MFVCHYEFTLRQVQAVRRAKAVHLFIKHNNDVNTRTHINELKNVFWYTALNTGNKM